ncbi:hypothetical protein [Dyadobacter alkalitolerans]|uniref:hypothetical protein n=1 Tax=Dyadobacter alkalitolerans TaxID=492736 RepID=UPI000400BAD0|nr:hypothetical protein [Dyadobacter alkalitolerans]
MKVVIRSYYSDQHVQIKPFVEVSVKRQGEALFCSPVGLKLPAYGDLQAIFDKGTKDQVIAFSGISGQQFDQVITEFRLISNSSVLW